MSSKRSSSNVEPIALPVDRNAVEYNMEHRKRGLAVIFNQENFDDEIILKPRFGTDADCRNLKSALEELSFEVEVFKDLSCSGIQKEVEKCEHCSESGTKNWRNLFISPCERSYTISNFIKFRFSIKSGSLKLRLFVHIRINVRPCWLSVCQRQTVPIWNDKGSFYGRQLHIVGWQTENLFDSGVHIWRNGRKFPLTIRLRSNG